MWRNQSQWHFCVVKMTFIFTSIYRFLLQALKQDNKKIAQMYTVFYTFQSQLVGCFSICINSLSVWSLFFFSLCNALQKLHISKKKKSGFFSESRNSSRPVTTSCSIFNIFNQRHRENGGVFFLFKHVLCKYWYLKIDPSSTSADF